ncbi:MAG: alpha/beta fold hydrolase [Chloroflexi bacterium]|nr:alpha/beta fold hydrolase [Chloroflexota bacterium]
MDTIANGVRLHYVEAGSGPAVVCIHGLGLNTGVWRHLMPELSRRYRAIAYDLRGMGKSEAPGRRGVTNTAEIHADDLAGFLDALGIQQAAIVAHAFGAFGAMVFAAARPERISALAVVNTSAQMGEPGSSQGLYRAATAELDGMAPLLDVGMARWFVERVHREQPEVIRFYREMLGSTPPMGYAASARALPKLDLRPLLGQVRCPTLVVAGEQDWSTPPSHHEVIARAIPGAQFVVVQSASHTVPEEQPEEFNRLTIGFLDRVLAPAGKPT